jgi:hypothetical protein
VGQLVKDEVMTDGQVVSLNDGTKAQVKQVQVNAWQTVLVAVELPSPAGVVSTVPPRQ